MPTEAILIVFVMVTAGLLAVAVKGNKPVFIEPEIETPKIEMDTATDTFLKWRDEIDAEQKQWQDECAYINQMKDDDQSMYGEYDQWEEEEGVSKESMLAFRRLHELRDITNALIEIAEAREELII